MKNETHEHSFDVVGGGGYLLACYHADEFESIGNGCRFWFNPDVDLGKESEDIDEGPCEWCLVFSNGDETDNYRADSLESALDDARDMWATMCEEDEEFEDENGEFLGD